MLSFLKAVWNSFSTERKQQELEELFKKECDFLDELIEKEEEEEKAELGNDCNQLSNLKKQIKVTECSQQAGTITQLNNDCGFIDEVIFFDREVVTASVENLKVGDKVNYLLYRNQRSEHLTVIKIDDIVDRSWDNQENTAAENEAKADDNVEAPQYFTTDQRNIIGAVVHEKEKCITVETEFKTLEVDLNVVECAFKLKLGDRVYLCCRVQNDEGFVDRQGEILEILSVFPTRIIPHESRIVRNVYNDWAVLSGDCYMTFDINPPGFSCNEGDIFKVDIIECERGEYNWRCIRAVVVKKAENGVKQTEDANQNIKNENHAVTVSGNQSCIFGSVNQLKVVKVNIFNNCSRSIKAIKVTFLNHGQRNRMISLVNPKNENGFTVPSKKSFDLCFNVESKFLGESRESFCIEFSTFRIKRSILVSVCENEEMAEAMCQNNNDQSKLDIFNYDNGMTKSRMRHYAHAVWSKPDHIIPGVNLFSKRRFVANRIPTFDVPIRMRNACLENLQKDVKDHLESMYSCLKEPVSFETYIHFFQTLLFLEEIEQFVNFRKYDQDRASFRHEREYLALHIQNLCERRPSLVIGDIVRAKSPFIKNSPTYEGVIHKVLADRVLLKFNGSFHASYKSEDYRLEFFFSRFTFRKSHYATELIHKRLGEQFLFPNTFVERESPQLEIELDDNFELHLDNRKLPWFNSNLNEFQKRAVFNILRGEAKSMPYIVFGPPGTGKTITIVETILQLLKHAQSSRLLVGAPSNSVANLIATRLIESGEVLPGDFVRLVAQNLVEQDLIPEHLMRYCATIDMGIDGSCKSDMMITTSGLKLRCQMKYLGRHRITIGTCATLGNYLQMKFPRDHFSHVIIDEAGQCIEPEIAIPITQVARFTGQIVLAGDHKQLAPIVVDRRAADYGLSISFLERILQRPPYQKDNIKFPKTSGFDPRLVTKLLYNYRALPSILKIYNDFFYDSELLAVIDEHNSNEANTLERLSNELVPASDKRSKSHGVFFHGIRSDNKKDRDSPSWYNPLEARSVFLWTVKLYRQNILPENIGIITPYAKQVKYLRNMFHTAEVEVPKIGTVEEFQGQERDIILISTVRSASIFIATDLKYTLGFVRCPKRMNVAISRARYLMVIFGNPHLLWKDPHWQRLIKICVDNDAYEGCDLPETLDAIENGESPDNVMLNAID